VLSLLLVPLFAAANNPPAALDADQRLFFVALQALLQGVVLIPARQHQFTLTRVLLSSGSEGTLRLLRSIFEQNCFSVDPAVLVAEGRRIITRAPAQAVIRSPFPADIRQLAAATVGPSRRMEALALLATVQRLRQLSADRSVTPEAFVDNCAKGLIDCLE